MDKCTAGTSSLRNELIHQSSDTNLEASVDVKEEDVKMEDVEMEDVKLEEEQEVRVKVEEEQE